MRPSGRPHRLLAALALLLALTGGAVAAAERAPRAAGLEVCPGCPIDSIAEAIAQAQPGARIEVRGGTYPGGLVIDRPLTLVGIDGPVIDGGGSGTLVTASGVDFAISGFTLRGTGISLDKEDAAIVVEQGKAVLVGNHIEDALFGIYLKQAPGSIVRDNVILSKALPVARRGDGIKTWYSDDVVIEGNRAVDGRDIILWYSNRGLVRDNVFDGGRYGLHLMFSDDARIEANSLSGNSIGLYVMYSRSPTVVGNALSNNHGPSGGGIGLKDVDHAVVEGNRFVNNNIAAQVDTSPREMGIENYFRGNVFAYNQVGIGFMPSVRHNTLSGNAFIDNAEQVAILGRGHLRDITWAENGAGNYWSDYAGFDADGDGLGDLPYRSQRLFESLVARHPALRLFTFSPAAMAVDFAARAAPEVRPETKLEDPAPLMRPAPHAALPVAPAADPGARLAMGGAGRALAAVSLGTIVALRRPTGTPRSRRPNRRLRLAPQGGREA
ncbi:MAG: nitrous oxide reductase family maturation protein NosD [Thermomicrobiales bacterium]|nr:nitrous oxide reductase family maturation protein NosD [Thermomicrobiales bacterium]